MMFVRNRMLAAMVLVSSFGAFSPAMAEDMPAGMKMDHAGSMAAKGAVPHSEQDAMTKAMSAMMDGMNLKPTGNADKDFAAMMIPHHEGAIAMAKVELQYGKDPAMRKLAEAIVAAQEKEIAEMKTWQAKHP